MSPAPRSRFAPVAAFLACCALLPGCDGNDDVADIIATTVDVTEDEFTMVLDRASADDGEVRFDVTNAGTVTHEFVVVRTNLASNALPTNPDGSYQENGAGTTVVGEIEDIAPGADEQLVLDLEEGHYVLLCNMVGPAGAHYARGMRVDFMVN